MRKLAMLAISACAACSFLIDTDGLDNPTGAPPDGGKDSAAVVPAEAGIVDAVHEGGSDVSNDATLGFCASHPDALLCDDFDQPDRTDLRTEGWTPSLASYPLGTPTTAQFFSPPRSARLVWDWEDAGAPSRVGASRALGVPASITSVTISARVRPELTAANDEQMLAVSLRSCVSFATFSSADVLWQESRELIGGYTLPFEKWTLFSFAIKIRPDGCDTTLTVGEGPSALVLPKSVNVTPASDPPSVVGIDLGYTGHDTVGAVSFDDILVVATP